MAARTAGRRLARLASSRASPLLSAALPRGLEGGRAAAALLPALSSSQARRCAAFGAATAGAADAAALQLPCPQALANAFAAPLASHHAFNGYATAAAKCALRSRGVGAAALASPHAPRPSLRIRGRNAR